jgi:hypothetical protein
MKPCKRGHTSGRYPSGNCIECMRLRYVQFTPEQRAAKCKAVKEYARAHPEQIKAYSIKYRAQNLDALHAYDVERYRNDPERRAQKRINENERRKRPDVKAVRRAERMKRIADQKRRTPLWADLDAIKLVYLAAEQRTRLTGIEHHVDHFYPLNGKTVSGLHTSLNLRVIPATENLRKGAMAPIL